MKKKARVEPRGRRSYPLEARVFSTNFLPQMLAHGQRCFISLSDFQALERKYFKLFKRYRREQQRLPNPVIIDDKECGASCRCGGISCNGKTCNPIPFENMRLRLQIKRLTTRK